MRKKAINILFLILFFVCFNGCGMNSARPEVLINFERGINEDEGYAFIAWDERIYIPYCAVKKSKRGNLIGIAAEDEEDQIYEFNGYSTKEWLISYLDVQLMPDCMLLREVNTTDIPEGLSSEYEWNILEED